MNLSKILCFLLISLTAVPCAFGQRGKPRKENDPQVEAALRKQTSKVQGLFSRDLARVAAWAAKSGLAAEAKTLLERISTLDPEYKDLEKLKKVVEAASQIEEGAELAKLKKSYSSRLETVEERHADRLYDFATKCMQFGLFTRAYDLVNAILDLESDHKKARKILGYVLDRREKKWITEWQSKQKKTHLLTEEGWIPKKWKTKWQKGLRNYKGQWVSIEEEKRIRGRNDLNPFRAETEHFEVLTNLGREEGYKYAQLLEDYYSQFFRVFIGYYDQIAGAKLLFNKARTKKKHKVLLFPSHNSYLTYVKQEHGNKKLLRESAGFYSSGDRLSRFYWSNNLSGLLNTMYHEITHQLFAETKETSRGGNKGNNWVVEGIAVYCESWEKVDGKWIPGHKTRIGEFQTAKAYLASASDWSLASFVRTDHEDFHQQGRGLNYALSGSLAHFFMHYDDEVYKEGFVQLISAYYAGKLRENSLVEYINVPGELTTSQKFELLQKQFLEYMSQLGESTS